MHRLGVEGGSMRLSQLLSIGVCLAAVAAGPGGSAADPEKTPGAGADLVLAGLGEPLFRTYCASCHGLDARGDGPAAVALAMPPADLRRIAQRRGGAFPEGEIARKIDGRFEISAHGSREMPVWGRVFADSVPDAGTGESIARGNISVLVEYLKSIQDPPGTPAETGATRERMGQIFDAMQVLLPLSLDDESFQDPANERAVSEALAVVDRNSAELERHGASEDVGFAHLARTLSIEARDVRLRYASGHRREARYLIQTMTETCVSCHSRLPATSAPRSEAFARKIEKLDLPIEQRAKLAYATRQFDVAADLYEQMLRSKEIPANDLDLGGYLDDYLELSIRVRRDYERPAVALEAFSHRNDLAPVLREEVVAWIASLNALASQKPPASPGAAIAASRELVTRGGAQIESERVNLVEELAASGQLHRALEAGGLSRDQRAEAYYLLGLIETRIGRTYWLSQAEAYLETAIRLAPGQPVAAEAYAVLDEFLVAGYSGSGGTHVPPDIRTKLDLLRDIAETPPEA